MMSALGVLERPRPRMAADLARCERLLAEHLSATLARFGSPALGVIDLPSLATAGELVPAQIHATAVLYWAREVEEAGLPAFVDALADGVATGRLLLPLTDGADKLLRLRRDGDDRFTEPERRALYERLFGAPDDTGHPFAAALTELVRLLVTLGREPLDAPGEVRHLAMRARVVARDLAAHCSHVGAGIAAFAAREIVAHVRQAVDLLRDPDIAVVLGGGGIWQLVRLHAPAVLGRTVEPSGLLARARAGLTILAWLADHASALERGEGEIDPDGDLVHAAEAWQAASRP